MRTVGPRSFIDVEVGPDLRDMRLDPNHLSSLCQRRAGASLMLAHVRPIGADGVRQIEPSLLFGIRFGLDALRRLYCRGFLIVFGAGTFVKSELLSGNRTVTEATT